MSKRRLLAILIAFVLTVAASAMWSASTIERDGDSDANALEDSGSRAGNASEQKKSGNKVARIFAAPFKAFGRLFSHKDDNKPERMTEKDADKFASVGVSRVDDARTPESEKLALANSAKEHLANGRSYLLRGRLNEAIAELSTAASLDPKLNEAHNLLGVAYDKKGLADRAKDSYERAVKVEPEDAQTLNNLGFSLYQNGNYRAAVDRLKRAVKLAPTDDRILNNLGLALYRLGKFEEAYKHFARAAGPYTGNLNTARMLERFGREEDAIKYYEDARRIEPNSTLALRRLADLYKRIGKLEESQAASNALAGISTSSAASSGR
ncbi:MAG TPA: tetratricopeptide repeat protein [Pyrinomonadaceae bacterium]|jgi:Flp pilus assembly protein TadD|nr:tetratricopeptide repeat protein [Pyrinomonadaceae bacterium]